MFEVDFHVVVLVMQSSVHRLKMNEMCMLFMLCLWVVCCFGRLRTLRIMLGWLKSGKDQLKMT